MARNRFKRKGKSKFILIEGYVKECAAFKALSALGRAAYLEVKWKYDGWNNGRIGLSCRELADRLNVGRDSASRALNELQEKGFIAVGKASAFSVKNRLATEWRLTEHSCDVTKALPTKDFVWWGQKNKTQSDPSDTQSDPSDTQRSKHPETPPHSPTHRTVNANFDNPQSDPSDTYRSTIQGETNAA
jgi:DNA-binding transcriptional MocR family regulator